MISYNAMAEIPNKYGRFKLYCFVDDGKEHLALVLGEVERANDVLVRIHSECLTGDLFGSLRCDCGEQLTMALARFQQQQQGILLYLRQEGRGIGLIDKLRAYNLQDDGVDTLDANVLLGHEPDERDYTSAARMLRFFSINSIKLLSNNPTKRDHLEKLEIRVKEMIPLVVEPNPQNKAYLITKVTRMGHVFPPMS